MYPVRSKAEIMLIKPIDMLFHKAIFKVLYSTAQHITFLANRDSFRLNWIICMLSVLLRIATFFRAIWYVSALLFSAGIELYLQFCSH